MDNNTFGDNATPTQTPAPSPIPTPPEPTPTPEPAPTAEPKPSLSPAAEPTPATPATATPTPTTPKSKKPIIIVIVIAILVVGLIIAAIFLLPKIFGGNPDDSDSLEESITKTNSFFIYDGSKKSYALFDIDGNQLTDFIFTSHDDFANGATAVRNQDEQKGIIGTDGKMIVDFGTCKYLFQEGSLYSCTNEDGNDLLLDAKGKTILEAEYLDVDSPVGEYLITFVAQYDEEEENGTITIYDYRGNAMTSFPASASKTKLPVSSSEGKYATVFYDGNNYVFDVSKSKLLFSFTNADAACINSINETNSSEFTMRSCSGMESDSSHVKLWFIRGDKTVLEKISDSYGELRFDNGTLIFKDDNSEHILDSDGKEVTKIAYTQYKDSKNFITGSKDDSRSADLYIDGEKKQKVKCTVPTNTTVYHGIYMLSYCDGFDKGEKIFMKYDGTVINKASYKTVDPFDKNGYAKVSEDGEEYYLIDTNGETVSDKYAYSIYNVPATKDVYLAENKDGTKSIFRIKDDVITTSDDIVASSIVTSRPNICFAFQKDNKYTLYNLTTNTELTTIDAKPYFYELYLTTTKDGKTQYYSCANGKMFYEGASY